jgi:hypothetical protein
LPNIAILVLADAVYKDSLWQGRCRSIQPIRREQPYFAKLCVKLCALCV